MRQMIRPRLGRLLVAALLLTATPAALRASTIPYPNPGVENPVLYTFTAAVDGDVTAYFFGSTAGFTNELTMLVNGTPTGIQGLNNHTSAHGDSLVLGTVSAGDVLIFEMVNLAPGGVGPWFSDESLNSDGVNHVYSTPFAGDLLVPAGPFVAFEDLPNGGDLNYNDETFVFTNVAVSGGETPEPASFTLLALGLAGMGGAALAAAEGVAEFQHHRVIQQGPQRCGPCSVRSWLRPQLTSG